MGKLQLLFVVSDDVIKTYDVLSIVFPFHS